MLFFVLLIAVAFVAWTNGANANFKGVASLYGSGTTSFRGALGWGTLTTFAGSMAALYFAQGLLAKFGGKGIVPDDSLTTEFVSAVALGAALTSFFATRVGFPVSTTHALVGALLGAGLASDASAVNYSAIVKSFFYPLLVSPCIAAVLGAVIYAVMKLTGISATERSRGLDVAHFLSAGTASFSRGLNDTPKMAALLLVEPTINIQWGILGIGIMIAIGALMDARRVAETLAKKVTDMTPSQGFAANLVTAVLVSTASYHSVPVSTTHVSVGSLIGMGALTHQAKWKSISEIAMAWIGTLPAGALLAAISFFLLKWLVGITGS